jgi:hypothetical protein
MPITEKNLAAMHCQLAGSLPKCWQHEPGTDWPVKRKWH